MSTSSSARGQQNSPPGTVSAAPDRERLKWAPEKIIELTQAEMYALPHEAQAELQLAGLRKRFGELIERVPMLRKLAEEQMISVIERIEDVAPLLVPHSAYKSYALSVLEKGQFDRLTRWLDGFTAQDLSGLDASKCESIDDWIDLLDAKTPIRVLHSSGTSGKLSFLPRSVPEFHIMVTGWRRQFDHFRDERPLLGVPVEQAPTIYLQYRHGGMAMHRLLHFMVSDLYGGDAGRTLTLHPTRFSADVASMGGRLRAAEAKGELGRIQLSPKLAARREAFLKEQEDAPRRMDQFLDELHDRFAGQCVSIMGHVPGLHEVASAGLRRGMEGVFRPDSFVMAGGGPKGKTLPADWQETVRRFFNVPKLSEGYGMTELVASMSRACAGGNFHIPPWAIPFLLDPKSGQPYPRTGTHTGRFGAYDLNAQTYWGGFLTGDEVTLTWGDSEPCQCGRLGAYVGPSIRRYTEKEGGDDKITCAGAPDAHDKAIDYIVRMAG
jgi:hypothetical protein